MMTCIFIMTPKECSFVHKGECNAPEPRILSCASNNKRLMLREDMKEVLVGIFVNTVVESPNRIKPVPDQDGRDILSH